MPLGQVYIMQPENLQTQYGSEHQRPATEHLDAGIYTRPRAGGVGKVPSLTSVLPELHLQGNIAVPPLQSTTERSDSSAIRHLLSLSGKGEYTEFCTHLVLLQSGLIFLISIT